MWNIDDEPRALRTVSDFAAVPPRQLPDCLRAFRQWLALQAAQGAAPAPPVEFVWAPPARVPAIAAESLTPQTEIGKLGLRPCALQQFRRMNIFALEDFSEVSVAEMGRLVNVGRTTVSRIGDMLRSVGLDFRADEAQSRPRPAPAARRSEPASFGDDTALADLKFKPQTIAKLTLHGVCTVGELRELTPAQLAALLSLRRRQEVFRLLRVRGLDLRSKPSELELWRHGLLHLGDLQRPSDAASVLSLEPWFGAALTGAALAGGIETVGQLHALAGRSGTVQPSVHGIGPYAWSRIRRFFAGHAAASVPAQ